MKQVYIYSEKQVLENIDMSDVVLVGGFSIYNDVDATFYHSDIAASNASGTIRLLHGCVLRVYEGCENLKIINHGGLIIGKGGIVVKKNPIILKLLIRRIQPMSVEKPLSLFEMEYYNKINEWGSSQIYWDNYKLYGEEEKIK